MWSVVPFEYSQCQIINPKVIKDIKPPVMLSLYTLYKCEGVFESLSIDGSSANEPFLVLKDPLCEGKKRKRLVFLITLVAN